jgi:hypothetical protein
MLDSLKKLAEHRSIVGERLGHILVQRVRSERGKAAASLLHQAVWPEIWLTSRGPSWASDRALTFCPLSIVFNGFLLANEPPSDSVV